MRVCELVRAFLGREKKANWRLAEAREGKSECKIKLTKPPALLASLYENDDKKAGVVVSEPEAVRAVLTSGGGGACVPTVTSRPPHVLASLRCAPGHMPSHLRLRTQQPRGPHGPLKSVDADTQLPSATATARRRPLRGTARSRTNADRPAGWSTIDKRPAMW